MEGIVVSGIQQLGIRVKTCCGSLKWYRKNGPWNGYQGSFFRERHRRADVALYRRVAPKRHAVLAMNLNGGGRLPEIWQYTDRVPQSPVFEPALGDLGIFAAKIKNT